MLKRLKSTVERAPQSCPTSSCRAHPEMDAHESAGPGLRGAQPGVCGATRTPAPAGADRRRAPGPQQHGPFSRFFSGLGDAGLNVLVETAPPRAVVTDGTVTSQSRPGAPHAPGGHSTDRGRRTGSSSFSINVAAVGAVTSLPHGGGNGMDRVGSARPPHVRVGFPRLLPPPGALRLRCMGVPALSPPARGGAGGPWPSGGAPRPPAPERVHWKLVLRLVTILRPRAAHTHVHAGTGSGLYLQVW